MADTPIHTNRDPITGQCLDCGASREVLDDGLAPTCPKFTGPHRLALIAIHNAKRYAEGSARYHEQSAEMRREEARASEDAAVWHSKEADQRRRDVIELDASMRVLQGDQPVALSAVEAVERTMSPYRPFQP